MDLKRHRSRKRKPERRCLLFLRGATSRNQPRATEARGMILNSSLDPEKERMKMWKIIPVNSQ